MSLILTKDNIQGHPLTNQRRLLLELLLDVEGYIDAKRLYAVPGPGMSTTPTAVYRNGSYD